MRLTRPSNEAPRTIRPFAGVLCGVDGTAASLTALGQALALREPGGTIEVLASAAPPLAIGPVYGASMVLQAPVDAARAALEAARELAPMAHGELASGFAAARLIEEAARTEATLIAVGNRSLPRLLSASVATHVLRDAPCSVLVARAPRTNEGFPRSIIVGDDGSVPAAAAVAVARELGERLDVPVRVVTAPPKRAVAALLEASLGCDLLVLGSRPLRGPRRLGSVSSRVADRAACSVLVLRQRRHVGDRLGRWAA